MKIRTDFVTNSSSSSFVCISKVNYNDELKKYFKDEYGKHGLGLLDKYLESGSEIKSNQYNEITEYIEAEDLQDDVYYLSASFIEWTNDGDTEGDDAWLYRHIPDEYKTEIYSGGE